MCATAMRRSGRRPSGTAGALGWLRENLFSSLGNSLLTLLLAVAIGSLGWSILDWAVLRAVWTGVDRSACAIANAGACWPFVWEKFPQWIFGFYPISERWRPVAAFLIGAAALVPMLMPDVPGKQLNAGFLLFIYPVIAFELLAGGLLRAAAGRDHELGRADGDAGRRRHRHRVLAAAGHPAGAGAAVGTARHPLGIDCVHRTVAGRAAGHRAVHGQRDAAAVPAAMG